MTALVVMVFVGLIGVVAPAERPRMDYLDNVLTNPSAVHLPDLQRFHMLVDSSASGYSMWTPMQECVAYNGDADGIQFVCRNYLASGNLDAVQTDGAFSFVLADVIAVGAARYPSSCASDGGVDCPHISAPGLVSGGWGEFIGAYEPNGWFTSYWEVVPLGLGDQGVHKVIAKQLPSGAILFVGVSETDEIVYATFTQDLDSLLGSGTLATGCYYGGFDINGGVGVVSYCDGSLNLYYKTTTDGVAWSAETPWSITWPQPYASNMLYWNQMAVTDAGTPVFVFDMVDGDDGTYPWNAKVYVAVGSGSTPVEVSDSTITTCWYPTIASDGDYIVVLYHSVNATSGADSLAKFDLYVNASGDLGATWFGPFMIEDGTAQGLGLAQLAKRMDPIYARFYYAYGVNAATGHDPIWHCGWDPQGLDMHRWYLGCPDPGIAEQGTRTAAQTTLCVAPNPVPATDSLSYTLASAGRVRLALYSVDGRLVRVLDSGTRTAGDHSVRFEARDLPSGAYVAVLTHERGNASARILVVK